MLDILEDYCLLRGYEYARLDGSTNRVQRRLDLRRYNAPDSNLFIFLISTRAGGVGINLASAGALRALRASASRAVYIPSNPWPPPPHQCT